MRFIVFILISICYQTVYSQNINERLITLSDSQIHSYGIHLMDVQPAPGVSGSSYPAQVVVPNSQIRVISAKVGGLIESIKVAEGDEIVKGQLLSTIHSPDLLELQRDLLQTLTQLNLAQLTLNRDKQLMEEGITPKRRYQESLSAWQVLQTQKEQQEASLQYSGMSLEEITVLENTRKLNSVLNITAPMDAILLEQMAIPGQKLNASDPLFKLATLSPLWIEIHVPVDTVSHIKVGDAIYIEEYDLNGEVITIGRQVHSIDQGTLVRAIVTGNLEQLRPGQFVLAHLTKQMDAKYRYLVPVKSIVRIEKKTFVFNKITDGFKAVKVDVLGHQNEQQVIVSDEAINGSIVVNGASSLKTILMMDDES